MQALELKRILSSQLPDFALRHLEPAISGEPEAAFSLALAAPNELRGLIILLLYLIKTPVAEYRTALEAVWQHDHRHLLNAVPNRNQQRAIFRRAQYDLSKQLPERVQIFRGTSALSHGEAERGLSWTTNRDVACWFAMRFANANGNPLVLRTEVARELILYYNNDRKENEVVCFDAGSTKVDVVRNWQETLDAWRAGFERYEQR